MLSEMHNTLIHLWCYSIQWHELQSDIEKISSTHLWCVLEVSQLEKNIISDNPVCDCKCILLFSNHEDVIYENQNLSTSDQKTFNVTSVFHAKPLNTHLRRIVNESKGTVLKVYY